MWGAIWRTLWTRLWAVEPFPKIGSFPLDKCGTSWYIVAMTQTHTQFAEIEKVENEYDAMTAQAEEHPERWGEKQETQVAEIALRLRALYEKHNVDEFDRIAGI